MAGWMVFFEILLCQSGRTACQVFILRSFWISQPFILNAPRSCKGITIWSMTDGRSFLYQIDMIHMGQQKPNLSGLFPCLHCPRGHLQNFRMIGSVSSSIIKSKSHPWDPLPDLPLIIHLVHKHYCRRIHLCKWPYNLPMPFKKFKSLAVYLIVDLDHDERWACVLFIDGQLMVRTSTSWNNIICLLTWPALIDICKWCSWLRRMNW